MNKKSLPICVATTKDGTRCGRRAPAGAMLCHIHQAKQDGRAVGALTEPAPFDPEAKLLKIAAKDGHPHQLQAIRLLRDRAECLRCKAREDGEVDAALLIRHANADQRARLVAMLTTLKDWKTEVRAAMTAPPQP